MSPTSASALKVQYDLRPSKQVERRMLVDAFQRLSQAGFAIRDYKYVGFGALTFFDFIIFHKLLGITEMLSIEHDLSLRRRVAFNRPFKCVDIAMDAAANVIPTLSSDRQHILWLDYDTPIIKDVLTEVYLAGTQLACGSIILITVDVEPPVRGGEDPHTSMEHFAQQAPDYMGSFAVTDFTESNLAKTSKLIILRALSSGMAGRVGVTFLPLFYFTYADGHRMMTFGGMIGSDVDKRKLRSINTAGAIYLRRNIRLNPFEINVPVLTRKERQAVEAAMPCSARWHPSEFDLPPGFITNYKDVYRFLPAYAELLI